MSQSDKRYFLILAVLLFSAILASGWMDARSEQPRRFAQVAPTHTIQSGQARKFTGPAVPEKISLGVFTAYAYCPCFQCCGQWSGLNLTASGTAPTVGRTVAADWSVLPAGTELYLDGIGWRTVEDTGSGIVGDKLDVFMESHAAALVFGVQRVEVWVLGQ